MASYAHRPHIPEDNCCWWCGTVVPSASGGDPKHSVFCKKDCEDHWISLSNELEERFQEFDD